MGTHRTHHGQRAASIVIADIVEVGRPSVAQSRPLDRVLALHRRVLVGLLHDGLHAQRLEGIVKDVEVGRQRRGMYVARNSWSVLKKLLSIQH